MTRNNNILILFVLIIFLTAFTYVQDESYKNNYNKMINRTEWFRNARFGMFIHWGPYSVAARGEWVKSNERMTTEEYQKYVDAFVPSNYHPEQWAETAKKAGMKYAVMTAKHHDGFCMFDSKYTDYKISHTMSGRDFIKEYVDAFRDKGLKVGLYYSLIDWHHTDYPNVGNHPMRDNTEYDKKSYDWQNYLDYMHNQIKELMTEYGKIDILWLDYSFDDYSDEKWKASELVSMIRKYQPHIILNNRLTVSHGISNKERKFSGYGDFETPEQGIPEKGLVDTYGNLIPWETCLTLNNNWGYSSADDEWKTPEMIIHALVNCVSKDGNLLLNIGPDSQGTIPYPCGKILHTVGEWISVNGESIYGCKNAGVPKPEWGYVTKNGNILYAHWTNPVIGHINIKNFADKVEKVIILHNKRPAQTAAKWWGNTDEGNFFINIKQPTYGTYILPDDRDTVLKIYLKE